MKSFIIGKPKYKTAIVYSFISIAFSIAMIVAKAWQGIDIAGYFIIIVTLLIVLPGLSYSPIVWKVTDNTLLFTGYPHFFHKTIAFYKRLFGVTKTIYQNSLKLNEIDFINITWEDVPMFPYGLIGHPIIFNIHTKDGSIIQMNSLIITDSKKYSAAVAYMKKQGIIFIDKHHILEAIADPTIQVSKYIDDIERGRK